MPNLVEVLLQARDEASAVVARLEGALASMGQTGAAAFAEINASASETDAMLASLQESYLGVSAAATEAAAATSAEAAALSETTAAASTSSASLSSVGSSMQNIGRNLSMYVTLPLLAAGAGSAVLAAKFDDSMALLQTSAGASAQEVKDMTSALMDLARNGPQGPDALAKALFPIESAGFRGAQALDILKLSSEGAYVGQANLADVANALTSTMASQVTGAETASNAMAYLNAIVGAGKMHMQDLANAMSTGILVSSHLVGLNLRDVGAALDTMTVAGTPAEEAATRLRMAFTLMSAPTALATKELKAIGLGQLDLARSMREHGLIPTIELLKQHLDEFSTDPAVQTDILSRAFGGARSGIGIETLVQNLDDLKSRAGIIDQTAGSFQNLVKVAQQTPGYQWGVFLSRLQTDMITLGNTTLPIFMKIASGVEAVGNAFRNLDPTTQKVVVTIGVVAAIMGPLLMVIGAVASGLGALATAFTFVAGEAAAAAVAENAALLGIPILIAGAFAAGVELQRHQKEIADAIASAWSAAAGVISSTWSSAADAITSRWTDMWNSMPSGAQHFFDWLGDEIASAFVNMFEINMHSIETDWNAMWGRMPNAVSGPLDAIASKVESWAAKISDIFGGLFGGGGKHGQKSGGPGTPRSVWDPVNGWITPDEALGLQQQGQGTLDNNNIFQRPIIGPTQDFTPTMPGSTYDPNAYSGSANAPGTGGAGGAKAAHAAMTQAEKDLAALAEAFKKWSAETNSTSIPAFQDYLAAQKLIDAQTTTMTDNAAKSRAELTALGILLGRAGISGAAFVAQQGLLALDLAFQKFKGTIQDFIMELNGWSAAALKLVNYSSKTVYPYHYPGGVAGWTDPQGRRHSGTGIAPSPGDIPPGAVPDNPVAPGQPIGGQAATSVHYHAPVTINNTSAGRREMAIGLR